MITTVAGNGSDGYGGDGRTGHQCGTGRACRRGGGRRAAISSSPTPVTTASARSIAGTRVITTVAGNGTGGYSGDGGPATAAELDLPGGVAVDAAGNLFIADTGNNCIREVNASHAVITTVAGNGTAGYGGDGGQADAAQLAGPESVARGRPRKPVHRRHRQLPGAGSRGANHQCRAGDAHRDGRRPDEGFRRTAADLDGQL